MPNKCATNLSLVLPHYAGYLQKWWEFCSIGFSLLKGFEPVPSSDELKKAEAEDEAKATDESATEKAALDTAVKPLCRLTVPTILTPLEALIPIVGEIPDIVEVAART